MSELKLQLNDHHLFGNDAAEDEAEEVFRSYIVDRTEVAAFRDSSRTIVIARAYKGEGKSALLRIINIHLNETLPEGALCVAKAASDITPELVSDDYGAWVRAWKATIFGLLAAEIGARVGYAWSDDAMTLVDQAEKQGFRSRGFVSSVVDRLTGAVEIAGQKVALPQQKSPELSSLAGAVTRRAKDVAEVWLLVDDLDKNFENTRLQRIKIAAFFDAIREMTRAVPELHVRAAIRPNVWTAIKMEFESLSHVEQYIIDLHWTEEDARQLIARRVEGYLERRGLFKRVAKWIPTGRQERETALIAFAFEPSMPWGGGVRPPHVLIYTLSKHRPRWMIELCKVAATNATRLGRSKITHEDLIGDLAAFGDRRIQDTVAEFKSQCGQIEELITAFNRQPEQMTTAQLLTVIENRVLQHAEPRISGIVGRPKAIQVAAFLFEIGFIFGRRDYEDGTYEHLTFSEKPSLFRSRTSTDDGLTWEVHPVYRQSLEMRDASGKELRRNAFGRRPRKH